MLIVDLGCAWLKFPATLKNPDAKNEDVIGVDVCRYNNDVVASALSTPFKNGIADLVVCRQFIEHVCPEGLVREAWRILKPDGEILIETPNCLYIFKILRALRNMEANPYPEHIQVFSAAELRNLLGRNGFKQVRISYYNIDVSNSNVVLKWVKKAVAYVIDKLFPMFDRDIRVIATKDSTVKFAEYC
jgi:SAM-dependent methyltransferase